MVPCGVSLILEIITDNKNRSVAEIRHLLTKYGGNLGENGSVMWMFEKKGIITSGCRMWNRRGYNGLSDRMWSTRLQK